MDKLLVSDYMKNNKCNSSSGMAKKNSRKRSVKAQKKTDKQIKVIESQVFDKIKEIKIGETDILNLTRNPSALDKKGPKNYVGW
tara:strand:- start:83 stop:334 length:252 start_codon:yes stop_codon:yes gene_type:complete